MQKHRERAVEAHEQDPKAAQIVVDWGQKRESRRRKEHHH